MSIDIDLGKTRGMKKVMMRYEENITDVVNKFAEDNSKGLFCN